jgi:predicted oxidoreductase
MEAAMEADVIVVGGGLAGLVATHELVRAGKRVAVVDQENAANLGGQAFWSLGGVFLVDTPEQRRLRVRDSFELARQDWQGSAGWDRLTGDHPQDEWAARWGRAYVDFAAGEERSWLRGHGVRFTPMVGWAERGDGRAGGHGNSVPRFHVAWGTGTGLSEPFADRAREAAAAGSVRFYQRHRVDDLVICDGTVIGVAGTVLAPDQALRGVPSNRTAVGQFELTAQAVVLATGGIGGDHSKVRRSWPARLGTPPKQMITGVPAYVDGRMLDIAEQAGVRVVNKDRMWHYTEGIQNWDPIWPDHAIRILPGPSSMWFDALGRSLPAPGLPGYDTLGTLKLLRTTADIAQYDHSWFILTQKIIEREFALSGSEQNPDITGHDLRLLVRSRLGSGAPPPVEAFKERGRDFVVAGTVRGLVAKMNELTDEPLLHYEDIERQIAQRDAEIENAFSKDGLPIDGLYAAGEAAGFGGGGAHGYNALEGTFLGGCLFTGRTAGRSLVRQLG